MPAAAAVPFRASQVSQQAHVDNDNQEDAWRRAAERGLPVRFLALVVLAGIGLALALLLLGRPRKAPQERLEAVPVPIQND